MEDYYEYLDSNGVTTLYKLIKDDTVAIIDSYSVTLNGITTNLDNHVNNTDIHTPIADIEGMISTAIGSLNYATPDYVDTKISGLVNSAPETLDTLKELSDALGNDPNFATTIATQIGSKANSVHNHVVSDITDFPTIPTKLSQLENDMGFSTGGGNTDITISWTNITDKPTIPTKTSDLTNDSDFVMNSDVVHTSGDEYINGTKMFSNTIHRYADLTTSGGEQVYRFDDTNANACGHIYNNVHWDDNAVFNRHGAYNAKSGKSMEIDIISNGSGVGIAYVSGTATKGNLEIVTPATGHTGIATMGWVNNPATSTNVVHRSGDETINGSKTFTNQMYLGGGGARYGQISAKDNNSILRLFGGTSPSTGANLDLYGEGLSSGGFSLRARTSDKIVGLDGKTDGTLKWNGKNVALDENLVHKTGNETIAGTKTFSGITVSNKQLQYKDTQYDWSDTSINTWCDAGHVSWYDKTGNRRIHELVGANGGVWRKACYINENQYFSVDSNKNISYWGTSFKFNGKNVALDENLVHRSGDETIAGNKTFSNKIKGNLQGNADTATKASYLDNYSVPSMNKIYLDWDKQVGNYVGLKVDNTTMGGLITTKNIGSQAANSATYATTQATSDNSTKIATTAWVRTYVNSVAGSNTVGSSVSAYWSNSSNVTATGQSSSGGNYPACYSEYITKTPVVGTIYSGAQLYTVLNAYASAKASTTGEGGTIKVTTVTAQAIFGSPINPAGKYLCTTANTVKFRAYTASGSASSVGASSVVDNSSTKSIFIRVQ